MLYIIRVLTLYYIIIYALGLDDNIIENWNTRN